MSRSGSSGYSLIRKSSHHRTVREAMYCAWKAGEWKDPSTCRRRKLERELDYHQSYDPSKTPHLPISFAGTAAYIPAA